MSGKCNQFQSDNCQSFGRTVMFTGWCIGGLVSGFFKIAMTEHLYNLMGRNLRRGTQ